MEGEAKMEELGPLPSRLTRDETTLRLRSPDLRLVPHQSQRVLLSVMRGRLHQPWCPTSAHLSGIRLGGT